VIEDDVLVGHDFFRWHEAVQQLGDYFCSVGWHCIRNPEVKPGTDPAAYIESERDFSSIGVCWKRERLWEIAKHASVAYYRDLAGYLKGVLPACGIPDGQWTEQAGLIMRILLTTPGAKVAWPVVARCAHVGIHGYHRGRGHQFQGSIVQRVEALRAAVQSTEKLVGLSKDPFDDVAALPAVGEWSELRVVQRFENKEAVCA